MIFRLIPTILRPLVSECPVCTAEIPAEVGECEDEKCAIILESKLCPLTKAKGRNWKVNSPSRHG